MKIQYFNFIGQNFWNMRSGPSEAIQNLLKEEGTTIEDLMREEDLIQEVKNQNQDLLRWMNRDRVKQLLNFII